MGRAAKCKVGSAGLLLAVITANGNDVDRGIKGFQAPIVECACSDPTKTTTTSRKSVDYLPMGNSC